MKTIAIFTHDPECSDDCCDGMIAALYPHYQIRLFDETEFTKKTFEGVDLVAFGGGIGDADRYYDFFKRREGNLVAQFVEGGGRYLGICMGAYWADRNYFDILDGITAHQYIKRPESDIRRSYATVAKINWLGIPQEMFFYDGPTFQGEGSTQVIARYSNGDPMAIRQGRIGLTGCHPESEEKWYKQYKYLNKKWHNGYHHAILLDFVNSLMEAN